MLSISAKLYIQASVPVLREHGVAITTTFYKNMLGAHPELNSLFNQGNQANGSQQQSLASAVFAYAANIDNLAVLAPVIERIVHKHASIGVTPAHYPIVGEHLLGAIKQVLGGAATPELIAAWGEAYWLLANALIAEEKRLYQATAYPAKQWLKMKVAEKLHLTDDIVSIKLKPYDVEAVPQFKPGQYISVAGFMEDLQLKQTRQYSLSDAPNGHTLRITVKREKGDEYKPQGMVSNWIHHHVREGSVLEVSHPFGNFTPDIVADKPIGLISAGVGITPMISVLKAIAEQNPTRKVLFAHAARSASNLVHLDEIQASQSAMAHLHTAIFLSQLPAYQHAFVQGPMQLAQCIDEDYLNGEFYICGPTAFMQDQWEVLRELGVPNANIQREMFGPESLSHLN